MKMTREQLHKAVDAWAVGILSTGEFIGAVGLAVVEFEKNCREQGETKTLNNARKEVLRG